MERTASVAPVSVWEEDEQLEVLTAKGKALDADAKLNGLFELVVHSPLMAIKYPHIAYCQSRFREISPLKDSIRDAMAKGEQEKRELIKVLENLISQEPSEANTVKLNIMLDPRNRGESEGDFIVSYILFQAVYLFVEEHMDSLQKPFCNKAILGFASDSCQPDLVKGKESITENDLKRQLHKLKEMMELLEQFLVPEDLEARLNEIRAYAVVLSVLDKTMVIAASALRQQHVNQLQQELFHKSTMEEGQQVLDESQELEGMGMVFLEESPLEARFEAAQAIVNAGAIDYFPGHIQLAVWQSLAEGDLVYRGLFKKMALDLAETINSVDFAAAIEEEGEEGCLIS